MAARRDSRSVRWAPEPDPGARTGEEEDARSLCRPGELSSAPDATTGGWSDAYCARLFMGEWSGEVGSSSLSGVKP